MANDPEDDQKRCLEHIDQNLRQLGTTLEKITTEQLYLDRIKWRDLTPSSIVVNP